MKLFVKNIFAVAASAFLLTGCLDYLKTVPTKNVSDQLAWTDTKYADMYITNFYAYLDRYGQFGNMQFNGNLTEGLTHTLKYSATSPGSTAGDANNYVFYPDRMTKDGNLLGIWDKAYEHIRRINEFLHSGKLYSTFTPEQNLLYEAQARFFRAYVYFQLAKRHGGVILYSDIDFVKDKARSSAEDTWNMIAEDLDFAAANLPKEWPANYSGRVTSYAAFALKSRAMLYAERWEEAKAAADSVIKSGRFSLTPEYSDSWKGDNSESILQFKYSKSNKFVHSFDKTYVPYGDFTAVGSDEFGGAAGPTQEMVEAYEDNAGNVVDWTAWHGTDPVSTRPPYENLEKRFAATILYNGAMWKGNKMQMTSNGSYGRFMNYKADNYAKGRTVTGYYLRKLLDENNKDFFSIGSAQTLVEIRYAEVLLNRAEALYRLGLSGDALNALKEVRLRAGLPARTGLSGEPLFAAIRHERLIELAYEGHLYWDMRRWKLAGTQWNSYRVHGMKVGGAEGSYTYQYVDADQEDRKFLAKTYVFPIPSSEINNNSAIEQYDEWK